MFVNCWHKYKFSRYVYSSTGKAVEQGGGHGTVKAFFSSYLECFDEKNMAWRRIPPPTPPAPKSD